MSRIASLPPEDRPRERLLNLGAHRLEPPELLALILGTGRGGPEDALALAERIIHELGGVDGLANADAHRLQRVRGIGPVKATRIRAAFELALRASGAEGSPLWSEPWSVPPQVPMPPQMPILAEVSTPAEVSAPVEVSVPVGAASLPEPPDLPGPPEWVHRVARLRGQVATGESALLGIAADPCRPALTLALGEGLGASTRPGAVLARLLAAGGGPWWLAAVRPHGRPRPAEVSAVARILDAAALVGIELERIVVVGRTAHWLLHGSEAVGCGERPHTTG